MPKNTKRKSGKKSRTAPKSPNLTPDLMPSEIMNTPEGQGSPKPRLTKATAIVLLLLVLAGVLYKRYQGWIFVARVNSKPISRWELTQRLTNRFGEQTLEALIGEKIILAEAQKQGIKVNAEEISAKISELEKNLKGTTSIDEALKIQGISREEFNNQVKIQLSIDKMFGKEVSVSAQEINEFVMANEKAMSATTEAERIEQAAAELRNNKINQKFIEWFNQAKASATVLRNL